MQSHHPPTRLSIDEDHPILGMRVMLPLVIHHPNSEFNELNLLKMLRTSCSLTLEEKLALLKKIPVMSQEQIDKLIDLLVNEHEKFEFIRDEFPEDVAELVSERMDELDQAVADLSVSNN